MDAHDMEIESIIRLGSQADDNCNIVDEDDFCEAERDEIEDIHKPVIGMEFASIDAAYEFYNEYSLKVGFGVRKSTFHKSSKDGRILDRLFVCCKNGTYTPKNDSEIEAREVIRRGSSLVGCQALMKIRITKNNMYVVSKFQEEHTNHELTSPSKTRQHRSHKRVHRSQRVKNLMTDLHTKGMSNRGIAKAINSYEGCEEEIVDGQQVHEHLRVERRLNLGQNCQLLIRHVLSCQGCYRDCQRNYNKSKHCNTYLANDKSMVPRTSVG